MAGGKLITLCVFADAYASEEREGEGGRETEREGTEWRIVHQSVGAQMGNCAHSRLDYSGDSKYDPGVKASYF